ncbi:CopG family transcriptional regulator [Novosphingobium sediminicola]|uniref:CopG family transcriptional regulator n=1 Tax=Novosphingobium sediminicola TaxID=563162 RepID=A0A7W6G6R7_9SPHN|nr:CopG family transcriptional regulator [Novosphingobium sediminicola]MBB3956034.1 hypothetical protein [Novosphingobium sediminicola]
MTVLSLRIDDALYEALSRLAYGANLPLSVFCRNVLTRAADPQSRYIYSSQDEILATSIQMLAILGTYVGQQSPKALEGGMKEARAMLVERGMMSEEGGE